MFWFALALFAVAVAREATADVAYVYPTTAQFYGNWAANIGAARDEICRVDAPRACAASTMLLSLPAPTLFDANVSVFSGVAGFENVLIAESWSEFWKTAYPNWTAAGLDRTAFWSEIQSSPNETCSYNARTWSTAAGTSSGNLGFLFAPLPFPIWWRANPVPCFTHASLLCACLKTSGAATRPLSLSLIIAVVSMFLTT